MKEFPFGTSFIFQDGGGKPEAFKQVLAKFSSGWAVVIWNDGPAYQCWCLINSNPNNILFSQKHEEPEMWTYLP